MSSLSRANGPAGGSLLERYASLWQFVKFGLVGVMNTAVDYAVYAILYTFVPWFAVHYLAAQCVSYAAGTVNSYFVNKFWTFGEKRSSGDGQQFVRFALLNAAALGVSLGLLRVSTELLHFHPLAGKLLVTAVTVILNYLGSKLWVFRSAR